MSASRIRLTTGTLPAAHLDRLAASHPFVEQIDVVFPSCVVQGDTLASLMTTYSTAELTLSDLYATASSLATPDVPLKAVPVLHDGDTDTDDTWCIDPRGVLTLSVSKTLYEQLGVVGKKLPFRGCPERHAIGVPLQRAATPAGMQARHRAAMAVWDRTRHAAGRGRWHVAYVGGDGLPTSAREDVMPRMRRAADVYVPRPGDLVPAGDDDAETRLEALFEWVGMACLGAQRLRANDRVDPYVAVYEPPSPCGIAEVTHLRWKGHVMEDAFVQSVIDTAVSILSTSASRGDDHPFISITLHSSLATPVPFVPECLDKEAPPRVPGPDAEDAVSLLLSTTSDRSTWAIAECIGKWDARWGG